ncbi:tail fibers protein [Vibrio phage vB_VpP_NS8]|uniref:Tail tubular A n=1 Tax=Vibrio phage H256D1 TaxID=2930329 RepID=A0AAE9KSK4_9CAUD|nr:tail fibers protein [Vibrio phage vB_VpP_NS8]UPT53592.1 putative tail tubular A [Vibrio phage H256D1]
MTLLDAINISLTAIGEYRITSDTVRNPTIGIVKDTLETKRKLLLSDGWWFNEREMTLYPDVEGHIYLPSATIDIYDAASDVMYGEDENGLLLDYATNNIVFDESKLLRIVFDTPFEHMPEMAQHIVAYEAAMQVYANDLGVDNQYQNLDRQAQEAFRVLHKQNLRNRRYSTSKTGRYRRIRSALYT